MSGSVSLGPRLLLVASFVPEQACLGDIGTDHAYLPIYLWEQGIIQRAVAVDVHEGPFKSARLATQSRHLESVIDVRFGDGLKPIQPREVDTLTLAGMGGNTMLEIFDASPEVMTQVKALVLQPQGAEGKVRLTLVQSGWKLRDEQLVEEEGRIYVVMNYSRESGLDYAELEDKVKEGFRRVLLIHGESTTETHIEKQKHEILSKLIWEFGPVVLEHPVPELKTLIDDQIQNLSRVTREMQKSTKQEVQERIHDHLLTLSLLEGLKKCLFPSA